VIHRLSSSAWRAGQPYVLAPAMTAIVAAAGGVLNLAGETLHDDSAPDDFGVLFPRPDLRPPPERPLDREVIRSDPTVGPSLLTQHRTACPAVIPSATG
jgi:hypothetical protein